MQAFIGKVLTGQVNFSYKDYLKVYFSGCDFKCPICNTPELLETKFEQEMDLRDVFKEMEDQKENVEGVFVTGGEPLFQKQALLQLLQKVKENELKAVIDTNGSKPEIFEKLLKDELLDIIIMDLKAPFNQLFEKVTKSATWFKSSKDIRKDLEQTLEVLKAYDETVEVIFRTTIIPGVLFRKEELLEIAKSIKQIHSIWELQPFRPGMINDNKMKNINSPTNAFMNDLRESIIKEYPQMDMRIIT